jgi:excisionase family DNA binding protein
MEFEGTEATTEEKARELMNTASSEARPLITPDQAAQRMSVCRRTLEREIARKNFPPPLKIGRASRFRAEDVDDYLRRLEEKRDQSKRGEP